jgi:hypothetical protein
MDVYNHFELNNINELLTTNENEIISYIDNKCENSSTIKSKLCGIYKCYKVLNIKSDLFLKKLKNINIKLKLKQKKQKTQIKGRE